MGILLDNFRKHLFGNKQARMNMSRQWLFKKINEIKVNRAQLLRSGSVADVFIGQMFFFYYDPKTKAELPYYDRFPLVIPIEMYDDGFLGLNLHYLEPGLRVMLLDTLMGYANNKKLDKTTRLKVSYDLISSTSKLDIAAPCIKRYLYTHVQSRFVFIEPSEWDMAAFLPAEYFVKSTKQRVWTESRNSI